MQLQIDLVRHRFAVRSELLDQEDRYVGNHEGPIEIHEHTKARNHMRPGRGIAHGLGYLSRAVEARIHRRPDTFTYVLLGELEWGPFASSASVGAEQLLSSLCS